MDETEPLTEDLLRSALDGLDLASLDGEQMKAVRGVLAMVPGLIAHARKNGGETPLGLLPYRARNLVNALTTGA